MPTNLCSVAGGNTGGVLCDNKRRTPRKILVGSKSFTSSEYATPDALQTAILASINLANGDASKLYPFPEIGEIADNTEADTTGSLALGPIRVLREGRPSYTYSVEIGQYQFQQLRAFNNKTLPVFTFDSASQFWGKRTGTTPNTVNTNPFVGELANITVSGQGFENGNDATTGVCTITISYLSATDFRDRGAFAILPHLSPGDLNGLVDVMLYEPSAHVSNVYKIAVSVPLPLLGGNLNLYDEYGAILAGLTWAAGTGANYGTSLTITSVAVDATNKCLTFTFDNTAWTALPALTKIKVTPPSVATLVGASMVGYEIGTIIVSK